MKGFQLFIDYKKLAQDFTSGISKSELARQHNVSRRTIGRWLEKAARTGQDGLASKVVPYGHNVKGISTLYDKDGNVTSQWVKTKVGEPDLEELAEYFVDAFKEIEYRSQFIENTDIDKSANKFVVYPLADLHIGMMAWEKETGDNYDLQIAKEVILDSFQKLVDKTEATEECIIINLGDAIHMNDSSNATPASKHNLDVDGRYQKVIYTAVDIFVNIIDIALQKHNKIVFRNVRGNHDPDAIVALNVAMKMFAKDDYRIEIDDSPVQLQAYRRGNNLIGCFHGHTMKAERAALALADDFSYDWGMTTFKHLMHGHWHTKSVVEAGSVDVEGFNTISARDAYAANGGYRSKRRLTSITYDYHDGEDSRAFVNYYKTINVLT